MNIFRIELQKIASHIVKLHYLYLLSPTCDQHALPTCTMLYTLNK